MASKKRKTPPKCFRVGTERRRSTLLP
jgi:hypothetical protein